MFPMTVADNELQRRDLADDEVAPRNLTVSMPGLRPRGRRGSPPRAVRAARVHHEPRVRPPSRGPAAARRAARVARPINTTIVTPFGDRRPANSAKASTSCPLATTNADASPRCVTESARPGAARLVTPGTTSKGHGTGQRHRFPPRGRTRTDRRHLSPTTRRPPRRADHDRVNLVLVSDGPRASDKEPLRVPRQAHHRSSTARRTDKRSAARSRATPVRVEGPIARRRRRGAWWGPTGCRAGRQTPRLAAASLFALRAATGAVLHRHAVLPPHRALAACSRSRPSRAARARRARAATRGQSAHRLMSNGDGHAAAPTTLRETPRRLDRHSIHDTWRPRRCRNRRFTSGVAAATTSHASLTSVEQTPRLIVTVLTCPTAPVPPAPPAYLPLNIPCTRGATERRPPRREADSASRPPPSRRRRAARAGRRDSRRAVRDQTFSTTKTRKPGKGLILPGLQSVRRLKSARCACAMAMNLDGWRGGLLTRNNTRRPPGFWS